MRAGESEFEIRLWREKMAAPFHNITALAIDAGHGPNIDYPEKAVQLVRNYLTEKGKVR